MTLVIFGFLRHERATSYAYNQDRTGNYTRATDDVGQLSGLILEAEYSRHDLERHLPCLAGSIAP